MSGAVLVAGVGNVFFCDDAFGVEVARRLAERDLPAGTSVGDFGTRSVHLAYELAEGYKSLILVDALDLGEPPGTLAVLDAGEQLALAPPPILDAHTMSPASVVGCLARLGVDLERVVVVGCQPACLDEGEGLSAPVAAAVEPAVELCLQLAQDGVIPGEKGNAQ